MVIPVVTVLHFFTQKWMDKRDGHVVQATELVPTTNAEGVVEPLPPKFYALLPAIPLALILILSSIGIESIKMDIIKAMFIVLAIDMILVFMRLRNGKKVLGDIQVYFDGPGMQMANVITLIVAGETFAKGLTTIGTIDTIINYAQSCGFGARSA